MLWLALAAAGRLAMAEVGLMLFASAALAPPMTCLALGMVALWRLGRSGK